MKNSSLIFQVVLAIAVGVLYFLHFSKPSDTNASLASLPAQVRSGNASLVYVNIDSLLEHYQFYQEAKSGFEKRQKTMEEDLEKRKNALEAEYGEAQSKARGGLMTEAQMQETEAKLTKKQQDLVEYKNSEEEKLAMENQQLNKELYGKLSSFLTKMNKTANYQFVFGYTREGGILLANDSLNITKFVVEGLNNDFKESK